MNFLEKTNRLIKQVRYSLQHLRPRPPLLGEVSRFDYQQWYNKFKIPPDAVVLDIGSGGDPFPYATLLTDRYIEPTHHRTAQLERNEKPFMISAVERLPFASKAVDFVFCAHVLEHVDDPILACSEIVRVGKKGYIETPILAKDMLFSWAKGMHKWHLMNIANKLVFFEYSERQLEGVRSSAWHDAVFSPYFNPMQDVFYNNQDIFNVMLNWENGFDCFVFYLDGRWENATLS